MTLSEQLIALIKETSLEVSTEQVSLLIQYVELLNKWNKAYNLTSIRDPKDMIVKHIMDSLRQVVFQLKLGNVTPVKSRVEQYHPEQPFDGVLSRAFSSLIDMVTWCEHLVSAEHGRFLALKGIYPEDEISALPSNISLTNSYTIIVPQLEGERHLIELVKS